MNDRPLKVLVVDNNETNRKILCRQMKAWNMKPTEADSGERALELLLAAAERAEPYALVILDLQMPSLDGFELARHIRAESFGDARLSGRKLQSASNNSRNIEKLCRVSYESCRFQ